MNRQKEAQKTKRFESSAIPTTELPFTFEGMETELGRLCSAKLECPGVYSITTERINRSRIRKAEYIAVMEDAPAISPEARVLGSPFPTNPKVLLYNCGDCFDKGLILVRYEVQKYLADHGLPQLQSWSLRECELFGRYVFPEHFGEIPAPTDTPWGKPLRCSRMWNGLYWLETEKAGWVLAIAYPYCDELVEETVNFASLLDDERKQGIDRTMGFLFYTYEMSCLPVFELLDDAAETWGTKVNEAALKNAILKSFPSYAQKYARDNPDFPPDQLVTQTPGAGTIYYSFPERPSGPGSEGM